MVQLDWGLSSPLRLCYLSDLHLAPWTRHLVDQMAQAVSAQSPDLIALGGDLCDCACAAPLLTRLVERLIRSAPVVAIAGNHDRWIGLQHARRAVIQGGGRWLDESWLHSPSGLRLDARVHGDGRGRILLGHNPNVFPEACRAGYRLVLAGHLHGCNVILWERNGLAYPGAWMFRYNGRQFCRGETRMLVSLGVGDTVPLRWNSPREVLTVELR